MKNKNGFVFIETIVVIVTVLFSLLIVYSSYTGIIRLQRKRVRFDDPAYIYKTYALGNFLLSLYNSDGKTSVSKILETASTNPNVDEGILYITTEDKVGLFNPESGTGNEKRLAFFSEMVDKFNVKSMIMLSNQYINGMNKLLYAKKLPAEFLNYVVNIDTEGVSGVKYYFIVEYAEKMDGSKCNPNDLISNGTSSSGSADTEKACLYYYSSILIDEV